jgi:hypothetical protein
MTVLMFPYQGAVRRGRATPTHPGWNLFLSRTGRRLLRGRVELTSVVIVGLRSWHGEAIRTRQRGALPALPALASNRPSAQRGHRGPAADAVLGMSRSAVLPRPDRDTEPTQNARVLRVTLINARSAAAQARPHQPRAIPPRCSVRVTPDSSASHTRTNTPSHVRLARRAAPTKKLRSVSAACCPTRVELAYGA